ncbi:MAG TPA: DUF2254 family protein [Caldilineaceae bacterium]|nr:DUF2254 family protein [Caldilineaceae bacterium]
MLFYILLQAAHLPDGQPLYRDAEGEVRVLCLPPTFAEMTDLAFNQLRLYTRTDVILTLHLIDALSEIAGATNLPDRQLVLWRQAGLISRSVDRQLEEPLERQQVNERLRTLAAHLHQPPAAVLLAMPAVAPEHALSS